MSDHRDGGLGFGVYLTPALTMLQPRRTSRVDKHREIVVQFLETFVSAVGSGTVLELGSGPGWDADQLERTRTLL